MSITPATRKPPQPRRSHLHHMHVFRRGPRCWMWDCPCGGGTHGTAMALTSQHQAFTAALNHATTYAGE